MRCFGLIAGILLANVAFAEDVNLCDLRAIKDRSFESCTTESLVYYVKDISKKGQLIRGSHGSFRMEHVAFERVNYFLHTEDKKLIDLGDFPQRASDDDMTGGATECLALLLLKLKPSEVMLETPYSMFLYLGPRGDTGFKQMTTFRYQLENNHIVTHYEGKPPFEGSAQTRDGKICTGDLWLKKDLVDWNQAKAICEKSFAKDLTDEEKPYVDTGPLQSTKIEMRKDEDGLYYHCSKIEQRPGERWNELSYRISLDPKDKRPLVLQR